MHKRKRQEQQEQEAGISFNDLRAQKSDLSGAGGINELSCSFNDLSSQPAHGMQEKAKRYNKTFNSIQQLQGKYWIITLEWIVSKKYMYNSKKKNYD